MSDEIDALTKLAKDLSARITEDEELISEQKRERDEILMKLKEIGESN